MFIAKRLRRLSKVVCRMHLLQQDPTSWVQRINSKKKKHSANVYATQDAIAFLCNLYPSKLEASRKFVGSKLEDDDPQ